MRANFKGADLCGANLSGANLRDADLPTDLRHLRTRSQQDLSLTKLRYDLFRSVTFLRHNQTSIWSQKPHDSTRSLDSVMGVRSIASLQNLAVDNNKAVA